jgi:RNA polymerase sigma factor (sigma-70 family)
MLHASTSQASPSDDQTQQELAAVYAAVRAFTASHSIPGYTTEELRQEGCAAWWEARATLQIDPTRNPEGLVWTVVSRRLMDLLKRALAAKRGNGEVPRSLDAPLHADEAEGATLYDVLPGGFDGTSPEVTSEEHLRHEVIEEARARLTRDEQVLFDLKRAEYSTTEIARQLNRKRTTVDAQIERLYEKLRSPALARYLRPFIE